MMAISTRGRYSLRILILMASHPQGRMFTKKEIADSEAVPSAYVQQLMTALRTAGLVSSHRGKVGGFTLARPSQAITVADVLRATEGQVLPAPCLGYERCDRESFCAARPVWAKAAKLLEDYLSGVSIADLREIPAGDDPRLAEQASGRSAQVPCKVVVA
jgi:Rrf2 family protein